MDFIKENLVNWMREWLVGAIMNNLAPMFEDVQSHTTDLQDLLTQSPASYEGGAMWDTAVSVASSVMMPLAMLLLSAVVCIEFIEWLNERNNMHTTADVTWMFFRSGIKILIAVLLVQNAPEITEGIFQIGTYVVAQVPGNGTSDLASAASLAEMQTLLEEKEIGYLISMLITSLIGRVGIMVIGFVIQIVVIGRMFKICLYCSMGAVPYATLMNKQMSGIGENYLKNLFAIAFQGFFMFVIVVMYASLTRNVAVSADPNAAIVTMLKYSLVFAYALFNTTSLSKSIFNAH